MNQQPDPETKMLDIMIKGIKVRLFPHGAKIYTADEELASEIIKYMQDEDITLDNSSKP